MWIAVQEGLLKCHEAQKGVLKGKKFLKAVKAAEEMGFDVGLKQERVEPDVERFFIDNPNGTKSFVSKWVAEELMDEYRYITQIEGKVLFVYEPTQGIYKTFAEQQVEKITQEKTGRHAGIHRCKEIIAHIKRTTYKEIQDSPIEFMSVKNGLLNIFTRKLLAFNPDYFILNQIPIKYDPKAKCPKIIKFLGEIVSAEDMLTLQEFLGCALLRNYQFQKALLLMGDGANGKTTLIRLFMLFLGKKNCSKQPLQILMINRFAVGHLYGKLANIYDDLPDIALKNIGFFKMLTGEGTVSAEFKFKDRFDFENYAKMIFTCNIIPPCPEDTIAFFRRWLLINFPNVFLPEDPKTNPNLLEELTTPEEMSGLLNWALDGLDRLMKNKHFSTGGTVEEIRARYLASSEPVKSFAENCLEPKENNTELKDNVYNAFLDYCKQMGIKTVAKGVFSQRLPQFIKVEAGWTKVLKKSVRSWKHIKLLASRHALTLFSSKLKGCVNNNTPYIESKKREQSVSKSPLDRFIEEHGKEAEEFEYGEGHGEKEEEQ